MNTQCPENCVLIVWDSPAKDNNNNIQPTKQLYPVQSSQKKPIEKHKKVLAIHFKNSSHNCSKNAKDVAQVQPRIEH